MKRTGVWILALACVITGWWLGSLTQHIERFEETTLNGPLPRTIGPFELIDHHGRTFGRQQLTEQWTLVYLGYLSCPDVCPITLHELTRLQRNFDATNIETSVQVLFVSVDPHRDTPERIHEYLDYFNRNFIGATASIENLSRFAEQLGLAFIPVADPSEENYRVDHAASVAIINPRAELHALIEAPHNAASLESRLKSILSDFNDKNRESG